MIDDTSMDTKFDDFAKRHGPIPLRTDTAAYRDAMDASKNDLFDSTNGRFFNLAHMAIKSRLHPE